MDAVNDWTLTKIIYFLKSALGLAEYELSQNTGAVEDKEALQDKDVVEDWKLLKDEEGNEAWCEPSLKLLKNTPIDKRNTQKFPRPQYGKYNLDIHYTLGRGVPEALGDDVDGAVFLAFREATGDGDLHSHNHREFDFKNVGITTELWWDKYGRCVYLHLELVRTNDSISWEENGFIGEEPPERPLN